jgi:hypothetical protein
MESSYYRGFIWLYYRYTVGNEIKIKFFKKPIVFFLNSDIITNVVTVPW